MKTFILATALAVASAFETAELFKFTNWMAEHGKSYKTAEEFEYRVMQFLRREEAILKHNAGDHSFTMGHNSRSDWSDMEFRNILTYLAEPEQGRQWDTNEGNAWGAPKPVDWRSQGAVNKIQDQGTCGSCWAFSTVQAMEGRHKIANGHLQKFSEQQLVDCSTKDHGCGGGTPAHGFDFYRQHDAITGQAYPYTGTNGRCQGYTFKRGSGTRSSGHKYISQKNPDAMKTALQTGPISVAIEADKMVFQNYKSGIFDSTSCGTDLDHAVGVVGWGSSGGRDYWIVRNSWGKTWGEAGYIRMAVESGAGVCGIQKEPVYPKDVN